jgi:hypothetical protein
MQGGHNWQPMAYSPKTGLVYIPAMEAGMVFIDAAKRPIGAVSGSFDVHGMFVEGYQPALMKTWYGELPGMDALLKTAGLTKAPASVSVLRAWDPVRQKLVWEQVLPSFWDGGVIATAGNLVFRGDSSGNLLAYAADTGKLLHKVDVGTSIIAAPMTYELDGVQYVAVLAGFGGAGGVGGTSTGAPCSVAELKTMPKPCSSTSNAPGRGARGSSSRKTKPVNNRCAKTEARIARPPRPGRRGLSRLIGRRSFASAAPGRVNSGSVRRIGGSNGS